MKSGVADGGGELTMSEDVGVSTDGGGEVCDGRKEKSVEGEWEEEGDGERTRVDRTGETVMQEGVLRDGS